RSRYARHEVERLAARSRRGGRAGGLEVVVDTSLTLLDPAGALYYRGHDVTRLARESTYEAVAELLWGGEPATEGAAGGAGARRGAGGRSGRRRRGGGRAAVGGAGAARGAVAGP